MQLKLQRLATLFDAELRPPCRPERLDEAAALLGFPIPAPLRELLSIANGWYGGDPSERLLHLGNPDVESPPVAPEGLFSILDTWFYYVDLLDEVGLDEPENIGIDLVPFMVEDPDAIGFWVVSRDGDRIGKWYVEEGMVEEVPSLEAWCDYFLEEA